MAVLRVKRYKSNFAKNEKNLREVWGIDRAEMAVIAGVTEMTIAAWEDKKRPPSIEAAARIGAYFDIHPAALVWGDERITEDTPTVTMGVLWEKDYEELLANKEKNLGTLCLSQNEMEIVEKYRGLDKSERHFFRRALAIKAVLSPLVLELTPDEERFIEDFRMASAEEQAAIRRRLIRSANGGVHDTRRSDDNRFDTAGEAALRNLPQR